MTEFTRQLTIVVPLLASHGSGNSLGVLLRGRGLSAEKDHPSGGSQLGRDCQGEETGAQGTGKHHVILWKEDVIAHGEAGEQRELREERS